MKAKICSLCNGLAKLIRTYASTLCVMLLLTQDRLHAAHAARSATDMTTSDDFVLPSIILPAKSMPANRRGKYSESRRHKKATTMAPSLSAPGAMSLAEIANVGPSTLDALKFSEVSAPRKAISIGQPQGGDSEALLQKELTIAAAPGPQEQHMSEEQQNFVADVRTEVLMFKPNKLLLLNRLHDIFELLVLDVRKRDSTIDVIRSKVKENEESAAAAKQHANEEIHMKEEIIAAKNKELMQGELQRSELQEIVKGLEERLNTAAGMGITADEAARTMLQLTKAKASIEAMKKQISGLEDKVSCHVFRLSFPLSFSLALSHTHSYTHTRTQVVEMEKQKRQEEMALKEKKAAIERQLKDTLEQYGPEKCRELTEQLQVGV